MSFGAALLECIGSTSHREVAEICGVTPAAVSNWVNDQRKPRNAAVVARLLDGVDASPDMRRAVWTAYGVAEQDLAGVA